MAEQTKRSMSDIRPVRGDTLVVPKAPVSKKTAHKSKPKPVAKHSKPKEKPQAVASEPKLEVERFIELEAPKKRSIFGWVVLVILLTAAVAYGVFWVYQTYLT